MNVNIDDCWMKKRGEPPCRDMREVILPNAKFPDIKDLGLGEKAIVRDLWRQKDLGSFDLGYTGKANPHGVILIRTRRR